MKTPLHCLTDLFQILFNPPSLSLPTPTLNALFVVLFLWLNGWSCRIWFTFSILWIYICRALVPCTRRTLIVFYATRHQVYWGLTHDVVSCWYFDLISHTHTHIDTQHTQGGSRLTDLYEYIFTLPAMSSQQLSLLHWMNNLLISKIYLPQCLSFFFFFSSTIIHL